MKFLFPTFLFAILAVAIPIIIHLFSFKQFKTVYFSNVEYLQNIKKESKKKSRLKQLLILIARILTIVFLVLAFAQPYIPAKNDVKNSANQIVAVYVDNSFSMNALSEQGQLLEVARNKALEISMAYPAGTKFRLFTNDMEPRHQNIFNKEQFIGQVSEIQPSPLAVPLSMAHNRFAIQNENIGTLDDKTMYFISDFQQSITDMENFDDTNISSYFMKLVPNRVANLYIDSVWVEVPAHRLSQEENVFVRIKNSSGQDYQNLPLKLYLNDSIKSITNFSVSAQNEITANLKYNNNSSGLQLGKVEITDYPFTHDNNWFISYFVEPKLKALAIFDNSTESRQALSYISALFDNDDYVVLDNMNAQSLQMSKLADYNTIFLLNIGAFSSGFVNQLTEVVRNGASIALFPTLNNVANNNILLSEFGANQIVGTDTTRQKISGIEFGSGFFKNVFRKTEENAIIPEIEGHLRFENNTRIAEQRLLWFQNSDKALSVLNYGNGKVWAFSFPLQKGNESFARDIIFVPTIYNIVLNSLPKQELAYTVGEKNFLKLPVNNNVNFNSTIEIENLNTGEKFIPATNFANRGARLDFAGQINKAGHFLVRNNGATISAMAFNYNRLESRLRYFSNFDLESKIEDSQLSNIVVIDNAQGSFSEVFDELQNGKQLWKWFIVLALLCIATEVLLSRFWK